MELVVRNIRHVETDIEEWRFYERYSVETENPKLIGVLLRNEGDNRWNYSTEVNNKLKSFYAEAPDVTAAIKKLLPSTATFFYENVVFTQAFNA